MGTQVRKGEDMVGFDDLGLFQDKAKFLLSNYSSNNEGGAEFIPQLINIVRCKRLSTSYKDLNMLRIL